MPHSHALTRFATRTPQRSSQIAAREPQQHFIKELVMNRMEEAKVLLGRPLLQVGGIASGLDFRFSVN